MKGKSQCFPHVKNKIMCDRIISSFRILIKSSSFYKGGHRKTKYSTFKIKHSQVFIVLIMVVVQIYILQVLFSQPGLKTGYYSFHNNDEKLNSCCQHWKKQPKIQLCGSHNMDGI